MVNAQLYAHLQAESQHMVDEMVKAHVSWPDIVETMQALVLQVMWHTQGFMAWWLS